MAAKNSLSIAVRLGMLGVVLGLLAPRQLPAQGLIDQQYAGPFDVGDLCCEMINRANYQIGQSFKPSQPFLIGVEVNLQNNSNGAKRVHMLLRQGGITGPILYSSFGSKWINPTGANDFRWERFDTCPIQLTPEATYTIQIAQDNGGDDVRWRLRSGGDPYTRGTGYRGGAAVPWDYGFRTYYLPVATAAQAVINNVVAPANATRGVAFNVTVNYTLNNINPVGAFVQPFVTASVGAIKTRHQDSCYELAGPQSKTFNFTLPANFPLGARPILVHVGLHDQNLASTTVMVNVN